MPDGSADDDILDPERSEENTGNDYPNAKHNWEEGKACKLCSGCSLLAKENEEARVKAAKEAAMQEVKAEEPGAF